MRKYVGLDLSQKLLLGAYLSVRELFELEGESYFRDGSAEICFQLGKRDFMSLISSDI